MHIGARQRPILTFPRHLQDQLRKKQRVRQKSSFWLALVAPFLTQHSCPHLGRCRAPEFTSRIPLLLTRIHDSAGQAGTGSDQVSGGVSVSEAAETGVSEALQPVKDLISTIQACIKDMRRLQMELRPTILDDMGIGTALVWLCREFQETYPSIALVSMINGGYVFSGPRRVQKMWKLSITTEETS